MLYTKSEKILSPRKLRNLTLLYLLNEIKLTVVRETRKCISFDVLISDNWEEQKQLHNWNVNEVNIIVLFSVAIIYKLLDVLCILKELIHKQSISVIAWALKLTNNNNDIFFCIS